MKPIKTALLSYGMSGKIFHAPFITGHPHFELHGCWERSKQEFLPDHPNAERYDSLEALLQNPEIELVVVNTPTNTHFDYTKRALEAGKHVVVEKAFTTTTSEAEQLKKLAEKKDKVLSVYQNRRYDSDFKTVGSVLNRNVLGDLVDVSFCFDRYKPTLSPKRHKEKPGPGAGIVKDLGPHIIDQALHLFGFPLSLFSHIVSTRDNSEVDDYFKILLFYPSFNVELRGGFFFKEPTPSYILHGKNGSFLKSRADLQETELQAGQKPTTNGWGKEPTSEYGTLHYLKNRESIKEQVESLQGNYMEYYDGIYASITKQVPPPVTADEGINVMKIIDAAFESHRIKRTIVF